MKLRSLLFVPGDRPDRFAKAVASGADAIILDLEDSVAPAARPQAREAVARYLAGARTVPVLVRVNPLTSGETVADLAAVLIGMPDGILLPKAEGADSVRALAAMMGDNTAPILPIATETPAAIFQLGTYAACGDRLLGVTWGAEDLPAAIGAVSAREEDGRYTMPYEMVRALTLFAAHAAAVAAIETVYPAIADEAGLAAYVARARRDGFTGMMAIHPSQVAAINEGFAPTPAEIERARRIVDAFATQPGAGALSLDEQMIDAPHLKLALRMLGDDKMK
jgi:citrate lyase subunit beta/citryl-CoA lyase